jgi:exosortase/archaeosortase family protein
MSLTSLLSSLKKYTFLHRLGLFLFLFILLSGISGSWLISVNRLLFPYHFWIYGSMGKVLLFSSIVLCLLIKDDLLTLKVPPWKRWQTAGIALSLLCLIPFFVSARQLLTLTPATAGLLTPLTHAWLIASVLMALCASFSLSFVRTFVRRYRTEVSAAIGAGLLFWIGMEKLFSFWPYLSQIVLQGVVLLLSLTHPHVQIVAPLTIRFPEFSITIGEYCSGIESLLLLSGLYFTIGIIDRKRLYFVRYWILYAGMMLGMIIVNIIRVYLIIQAGFLFSPQVAAKFFHTYLGILLFLSYFILTMSLLYEWVIGKKNIIIKE